LIDISRAIMGKNGVEVEVLRGVDYDIAYAGLVALLFAQHRIRDVRSRRPEMHAPEECVPEGFQDTS
jgi:hypothetical protein